MPVLRPIRAGPVLLPDPRRQGIQQELCVRRWCRDQHVDLSVGSAKPVPHTGAGRDDHRRSAYGVRSQTSSHRLKSGAPSEPFCCPACRQEGTAGGLVPLDGRRRAVRVVSGGFFRSCTAFAAVSHRVLSRDYAGCSVADPGTPDWEACFLTQYNADLWPAGYCSCQQKQEAVRHEHQKDHHHHWRRCWVGA